ncbi:MAG: hypothetical protein JJ964_05810 [Rhizobiales bacterium]|nr:hypothetical protein [Hyphomicrobiales bacterium]
MDNFLGRIKHFSVEPAVRNLYRNDEQKRIKEQTEYNRKRDALGDFRYVQRLAQQNEDRAFQRGRQLKQDARQDQLFNMKLGAMNEAKEGAALKKQHDHLARVAYLADTPEKWARMTGALKNKGYNFGDQYNDFASRESVLAEYGDLDMIKSLFKAERAAQAPSFKVPSGFMMSKDGSGVVPIPGGPKDLNSPNRVYTDGQVKSSSFAKRMDDAEGILTGLETKGYERGSRQVFADYVGNAFNSNEGQAYKQAREDWVRAKLRRESGAAIGVDEMRQEIELYFPKYGDSKEVIAQKRAARNAAMKNLVAESQGAFSKFHGGLTKRRNPSDLSDLRGRYSIEVLRDASMAIKRGADPRKVRQRLEGIR